MIQGWARWAWCISTDGWLQFGGVEMQSKGYIAQEVERLAELRKCQKASS